MIVVGAVDIYGQRMWFSQGRPLVKISAPGIMQCASENSGYIYIKAISFAAPVVAGLAAYFSLNQYRTPGTQDG